MNHKMERDRQTDIERDRHRERQRQREMTNTENGKMVMGMKRGESRLHSVNTVCLTVSQQKPADFWFKYNVMFTILVLIISHLTHLPVMTMNLSCNVCTVHRK